jgi:hypothetical protein
MDNHDILPLKKKIKTKYLKNTLEVKTYEVGDDLNG